MYLNKFIAIQWQIKQGRLIATYDVFELSVNIYNYVQLCGLIAIYDIFEFYNYLC